MNTDPVYATGPVDYHIRCPECGRLLIEQAGRPWRATCPRCKHLWVSPPDETPWPVYSKKERHKNGTSAG